MIRAAALALALLAVPLCLRADEDTPAAQAAARASDDLRSAVAALQEATAARDRVTALTLTIRAYEEGLAALREALRQAELREATLKLRFNAKRDQVSQLLAVLARMEQTPGPLLLLHPGGPLGTARSGMMLAEVTPALQAEAMELKAELQELADLRALQAAAGETLSFGLKTAQQAHGAVAGDLGPHRTAPAIYRGSADAAGPSGKCRHAGKLCRRPGPDLGRGRCSPVLRQFDGPAAAARHRHADPAAPTRPMPPASAAPA
jgi:hypothetical protein